MPSRETIWIVPVLVVCAVLGSIFGMFSPILALPILLVVLAAFYVGFIARRRSSTRRMTEFRDRADPGVEFTSRDYETLVPHDK